VPLSALAKAATVRPALDLCDFDDSLGNMYARAVVADAGGMHMGATKSFYSSMNDCLGPATHRFFGEGFKRVHRRMTGIHVCGGNGELARVRASAGVSCPKDWSTKATSPELRPHLSSVDSLLFGVQLAEIALTRRYDMTGDQRRRSWVRRIELRAGARPLENLDDIPVYAEQISWEAVPGTLCGHVSVVECKIGPMRVRCEIEHPADGTPVSEDAFFANEDDILGDTGCRYYGEGFKLRRQRIDDVEIDSELRQIRATVDVSLPDGIDHAEEELGARYQPAFSMLDCLVTSAQVGQALLYHEDGLQRGRTNTLWMRKMILEAATPYHALAPFDIWGLTARSERVAFGGGTWRTANMTADFQGIRIWVALAHKLPEGEESSYEPATR
jgi:hypothetical protein